MLRKDFLALLGMGGLSSTLPLIKPAALPSVNPIKPVALTQGDTLGLISPASIIGDDDEYDDVADRIRQLGYKVKEGHNARKTHGYFAGTNQQRAADLNAMFADPDVDAIMPFRGGWGSNRILEFIDYDLIADHPKILVGYSDITSLLLAIFSKTGLITFHGPVAKSTWTDFTIKRFHEALSSSAPFTVGGRSQDLQETYGATSTITPGKASGRLLGGNLSVLTSMIGSQYLPDWEDSILFLEDVGEDVYRVDRMMTQLKMSGILDQISGFIFGQCTSCDVSDPHGFTLGQILRQHIKPLGIPAVTSVQIGHIDDMLTLPVGAEATIDARSGMLSINEAVTVSQ